MPKDPPKLQPLSLQRLLDTIETTRDVTTPNGLAVRLQAMDLPRKLDIIEKLDAIELNDAGAIASQADALDFGLQVLSVTIIDEDDAATFDSEKGRKALAQLQVADLNFLIDQANELNGLSGDTAEKKSG